MSSESNYSFTTKINGSDLFTVRGDTYEEYLNNLTQVYHIPAIAHLVNLLAGQSQQPFTDPVAAVVEAFDATVVTAPVQAVVTAVPGGRNCNHGAMKARQGIGKDGKTWRGYMCMSEKDATDKCKNIYLNPSMPEWHTFVAS
jgi:hypothetical protein